MNIIRKLTERKTCNIVEYLNLIPKHYGKDHEDKTIYYICENNKNLGFFAMYRYWLEYLYFADICGYYPVIYSGKDFNYLEEKKICGTNNAFEYYFKQPTEIELQQVRSMQAVIHSQVSHRQVVEFVCTGKYNNYKYTQNYLQMMSNIIKKYVKFNEKTARFIKNGLDEMNISDNITLGVHIRGTDFRMRYNNHPIYVTVQECFSVIDQLLDKKKYSKIFIATDDKRILEQFIKKYGNCLCYYKDVVRSDKNVSVAFGNEFRENHKYKLGLEVIRDMYTLALCNGLVAGLSQVAVCAQMNKLARDETYDDLEIINKGIYKNYNDFSRHESR